MTEVIETSLAVAAPAVPMADMVRMAEAFYKCQLFGYKTPEQALALMLIAQAEGLHPAQAAREYHIIQGRPALTAEAMLSRFQRAGGKVQWLVYSPSEVSGEFSHPSGGKLVVTWTMDRAKRADLTGKDNWRKYPEAMLASRCISEGVRRVCPGSVLGVYTPEETEDFTPATVVEDEPEIPYSTPEERQAQRAAHEAQNQHLPKRVTEQNKQRSYDYKDVRVEMLGGGTMYPDAAKPCTVLKVLHKSKEICLTHYKHPSELVARIKAAGYPDVYDPTKHKGPITVDIVATPEGKEWRYVASNLRVEPATAEVPAPSDELPPPVSIEELQAEVAAKGAK